MHISVIRTRKLVIMSSFRLVDIECVFHCSKSPANISISYYGDLFVVAGRKIMFVWPPRVSLIFAIVLENWKSTMNLHVYLVLLFCTIDARMEQNL
jgi:hypothetical protein